MRLSSVSFLKDACRRRKVWAREESIRLHGASARAAPSPFDPAFQPRLSTPPFDLAFRPRLSASPVKGRGVCGLLPRLSTGGAERRSLRYRRSLISSFDLRAAAALVQIPGGLLLRRIADLDLVVHRHGAPPSWPSAWPRLVLHRRRSCLRWWPRRPARAPGTFCDIDLGFGEFGANGGLDRGVGLQRLLSGGTWRRPARLRG